MAIKGKSKRRSARAVTRGPKPAYVPVKTPLMARRGVWITTAVVASLAIAGGIWYGVAKQRSEDREQALREARARTVAEYGGQLEPIIGTVGEPAPPASWTHFPELTTALDNLEAGEGRDEQIAGTAEGVAGTANTAWEALDPVDVTAIVLDRGLDETFVLHMLDSKTRIVEGLKLFEQAAELVSLAATTPQGSERDALIERARGVLQIAGDVFDDGYAAYVEAQAAAGTFEPTVPGLPALTGPTG